MHKSKFLALSALAATLAGCATPAPQFTEPSAEAEVLATIAQNIQRATDAQVRLASVRGSNRGLLIGETNSGQGLDSPISISWSGPIDRLAAKIAELSNFEYGGIVGRAPATPVMVSIQASNEKGRVILLNANAQSGSAARIEITENGKKIVVRYPQTIGTGGFPTTK